MEKQDEFFSSYNQVLIYWLLKTNINIREIHEGTLPIGKNGVPCVTDFTSRRFIQVNFHDKLIENNRKCPKQNPVWIEGSFGFLK